MERYVNEDGLENLCNAIIVQAANDYRAEAGKLKRLLAAEPPADPPDERSPEDRKGCRRKRGPHEKWEDKVFACEDEMESIKRFFFSEYIEELTDNDGPWMFRLLREEAQRP